jgi:hypothetical protein
MVRDYAWHAAIEAFCDLQPKGATKIGAHGTRLITSGTPVAENWLIYVAP